MLAIRPDYSNPVKELLIGVYRRNGFDCFTACQMAAEYIAALRKEPPGTVWHLNDPAARTALSIRKD